MTPVCHATMCIWSLAPMFCVACPPTGNWPLCPVWFLHCSTRSDFHTVSDSLIFTIFQTVWFRRCDFHTVLAGLIFTLFWSVCFGRCDFHTILVDVIFALFWPLWPFKWNGQCSKSSKVLPSLLFHIVSLKLESVIIIVLLACLVVSSNLSGLAKIILVLLASLDPHNCGQCDS